MGLMMILTVVIFSIISMIDHLLSPCCLIGNINNYKVNYNSPNILNINPFSHFKSLVRARASKCLSPCPEAWLTHRKRSLPSRFNATAVSPTADASESRGSQGSSADRPLRRCPRVSSTSVWP